MDYSNNFVIQFQQAYSMTTAYDMYVAETGICLRFVVTQ